MCRKHSWDVTQVSTANHIQALTDRKVVELVWISCHFLDYCCNGQHRTTQHKAVLCCPAANNHRITSYLIRTHHTKKSLPASLNCSKPKSWNATEHILVMNQHKQRAAHMIEYYKFQVHGGNNALLITCDSTSDFTWAVCSFMQEKNKWFPYHTSTKQQADFQTLPLSHRWAEWRCSSSSCLLFLTAWGQSACHSSFRRPLYIRVLWLPLWSFRTPL